jgi:hypothetical protein
MKKFLGIFAICVFLVGAFVFFGGYMIFGNVWATAGFAALIAAVLISVFAFQEKEIEELQERVKKLEGGGENSREDIEKDAAT